MTDNESILRLLSEAKIEPTAKGLLYFIAGTAIIGLVLLVAILANLGTELDALNQAIINHHH